jgi:hypothetical protein
MNQEIRLMDYLKTNQEINPLEAWQELGIYRLSAVVHNLRKEGHNISTERKTAFNKWNEKCSFANYKLER